MLKHSSTLFLLILPLLVSNTFAAEVDNFTFRNLKLKDATNEINSYGNTLFNEVIQKTNLTNNNCDELKLYKNLRKEFRNGYIGAFIDHIKNSEKIERQKTPFKKSIYSQFKAKDALVTGLLSKRIYDTSATVLNINGHQVGTDKFEHFSGTGFRYFKSFYLDNKSIEETVQIGFKDEYGILGAWSTGVISYGDLSAEFNGMRFWNHILQKKADILSENIGPYVVCEGDKWKQIKKIDWSYYVDEAWDEAINCSEFRTWTMVAKVKYKLKELSKVKKSRITCPLDPEKTQFLEDKYQQYGQYILNFKGINLKTR